MRTQLLIPSGEILLGDAIEIAECRRQTVAAVLFGHAAQGPQRILQTFGERHKTLTAEYHVGMLEARECQTEVIEPMIEVLTGDRNAKRAHGLLRCCKRADKSPIVDIRGGA